MELVREGMRVQNLSDGGLLEATRPTFSSREWLNKCRNGKVPVSSDKRLKLEQVLKLPENSLRSNRSTQRRFYSRKSPAEVKNLIYDRAVSDKILGSGPPSFRTCVEHSCTIHPTSIQEKNAIHCAEFPFNHFFQPAVILRITSPFLKALQLLAYERKPSLPKLQFQLSQGGAILWAASYLFNDDRSSHCMDYWMEKVTEYDPKASSLLLESENCVLLELLSYKLQLKEVKSASFKPLGIVSINLAETPRKAIYTQYVFVGSVSFINIPNLHELSPTGMPLKLVSEKEDPEKICQDEKGNPRSMDVLAWQALHSSEQKLSHGNATFHRGFELF